MKHNVPVLGDGDARVAEFLLKVVDVRNRVLRRKASGIRYEAVTVLLNLRN